MLWLKRKSKNEIYPIASHKLEEQSDSSSKQTIIALALITALCLAGDAMLYIVLPTQWKEIGLTSLVQVGMLLSINRFVRLPLNPLIGYIYKKVNFRKVILIAVVLSGISTVGYGIVADFRIWIILRATWGIAWALFKLGGYLLILQLSTDTNRGNLVGTYNGLFNLGSLVGMLIGGFFADLFGLKIISIVLGTLAFFCISFVFKYIPKAIYTNENQVKKVKTSLIRNLKINMNKTIVKILFTALLFNMLLMGMLTAILSHIIDIKLTNEIELVGIVIGAATVAGIIQALRWGVLPFITPKVGSILDKTKQKNTLLEVFLVCSAIFLFLIPLPIHLGIWLPILFINLIIASIINTIIDSIITDCASRVNNKVFIMTIYAIVVDFGSALGPITGYIMEQKVGLANLFWISAGVSLLLSLFWLLTSSKANVENNSSQSNLITKNK